MKGSGWTILSKASFLAIEKPICVFWVLKKSIRPKWSLATGEITSGNQSFFFKHSNLAHR